MKGFKKLLTGILAATLAFTMNVTAMAAGSNTITVDGAVENESYSIYKLLDLDIKGDAEKPDGYSYTINDDFAGFWTGDGAAYITTNEVGTKKYVVWNADMKTAEQMEAFGKLAAAWAKANKKTPIRTVKADNSSKAVFDGLDNGYYMITSTLGTAVTIASTPTDQKQNIIEKNTGNTTEKKVFEAPERTGGNGEYGQSNDAAVGDVVTFRSKVSIAKNSINVKYHDTMTKGLTYNNDVKVYSDVACTEEVSNSNYTVAAAEGETFVVSFNDTYVSTFTAANTDLYIKYTATLNDDAVVTSPEVNTPEITWGDNGKYTGTPTETTTHKFQIQKYDGADANKNPLAGAKFQLFTAETAGAPLTLAVKDDDKSVYRVVADEKKLPEGYTVTSDNKIVTLATGFITVEGVDSDLYYLEETDAPVGFNKLEKRIKVTVNEANDLVQPIENLSGSILPSTGGMGTTTFYVIGAVLVIAAVAYFMLRRKADAE